jgi:hypothetical protein
MVRKVHYVWRSLIAASLCFLTLSGCAVQQLQKDHDQIRTALLDLYTNQIIDNLIRAHNGLPIIQLDYTNATALVTVLDSESLSDNVASTATTVTSNSLTPTLTNTLTNGGTLTMSAAPAFVTAAMGTVTNVLARTYSAVVTHGIANTISGSSSHSNSNQVALTATPVTTSNDVYDAYLHFLTIPGALQATSEPPCEGMAIICKKVGKLYYWVPVDFRKDFLALSLHTTAQRGMPVLDQPNFFVTLMQVVPNEDGQSFKQLGPDMYEFTVLLNGPQGPGSRVFNSDGLMGLDGQTLDFAQFIPKNPDGTLGKAPLSTNKLLITVDLRTKAEIDEQTPKEKKDPPEKGAVQTVKAPDAKDATTRPHAPLKATTAQQFIDNLRKEPQKATLTYRLPRSSASSTEQLLNNISFTTQQINMNLLQQSH